MNLRTGMLGGLAVLMSTSASAATVSLSGLVVNSCVLTVPTSGLLVADAAPRCALIRGPAHAPHRLPSLQSEPHPH